jgi:NAD(P)-dependent dehydrogenase (short-subunit alcohol dehydrogenase family)
MPFARTPPFMTRSNLQDAVVVICGAFSGIGRAAAMAFAAKGARHAGALAWHRVRAPDCWRETPAAARPVNEARMDVC